MWPAVGKLGQQHVGQGSKVAAIGLTKDLQPRLHIRVTGVVLEECVCVCGYKYTHTQVYAYLNVYVHVYLGPTIDQLSHSRLSWFCQETGLKASAAVQDPGWYWYPGQAGILPRAYGNVFTFNNAIITRVFIQVPTSCSLFYSLYFLLPDIIHLPQEGQLHKAGVFILFPALSQCLLKQMNVCSLHCLVWSSQ